eukprot:gb/GEZJ01003451.1/.p1 GENE.gb/GEZJ01003451.1/~~gb/GEZJ01003451.1/.p1  ORF type:complete len:482 (-),score=42.20 gb/GEZJ01003451.1/:2040-3485(-)
MSFAVVALLFLSLLSPLYCWEEIQPNECTSVRNLESFHSSLIASQLLRAKDRNSTAPSSAFQTSREPSIPPGLNFEFCRLDPDCEPPRMCSKFDFGHEIRPCDGQDCFCYTPDICCENDSNCAQGESCVPLMKENVCVSNSISLPQRGPNLNGEPCYTLFDCHPPRSCNIVRSVNTQCNPPFDNGGCVCMTQDSQCKNDGNCNEKEICQQSFSPPTCMAPPSFINERVNGERCFSSRSCKGSRVCSSTLSVENNSTLPCYFLGQCVCTTSNAICVADTDCDLAEFCVQKGQHKVCISKRIVNAENTAFAPPDPSAYPSIFVPSTPSVLPFSSPMPSAAAGCESQAGCSPNEACIFSNGTASCEEVAALGENICIAVETLKHTTEGKLLYKKHIAARVLCDSLENCATTGHMVLFRGQAMMMKSYCAQVGCKQRVKWVNSPRYQPGWRGRALGSELFFTAFAARFEAVIEEHILSFAIGIGL